MRGAVLTVGETLGSEVFFLKELRPDFVALICTSTSRRHVTRICQRAGIDFGKSCQVYETENSAEELGHFTKQCTEAYTWLKQKVGENADILFSPTAGHKWMSTGLSMFAARTPCSVYYVDATFKRGKIVPGTETLVLMGNVDDFAGQTECDRGVDLYNRLDFVGAERVFRGLQPRGSAAARELYRALATICAGLNCWERFEHYDSDSNWLDDFRGAIESLTLTSRELGIDLTGYHSSIQILHQRILEVVRDKKPSLKAITDLFFNACRRIEAGRLDDGVARLYRTLEASAQWLLSLRSIDHSKVNWQAVSAPEQSCFRSLMHWGDVEELPNKLDLMTGARLVTSLQVDWAALDKSIKREFCDRHRIQSTQKLPPIPLVGLVHRNIEIPINREPVEQGVSDEVQEQQQGEEGSLGSETEQTLTINDTVQRDSESVTLEVTPEEEAIEKIQTLRTEPPPDASSDSAVLSAEKQVIAKGEPERTGDEREADWRVLEETCNIYFNQQGNFAFAKHIEVRNYSILGHGWTPVAQTRAESFCDAVQGLLQVLGADLAGWEVPKLPKLWS